eukprot:4064161-Amphidinium_carterae.1
MASAHARCLSRWRTANIRLGAYSWSRSAGSGRGRWSMAGPAMAGLPHLALTCAVTSGDGDARPKPNSWFQAVVTLPS